MFQLLSKAGRHHFSPGSSLLLHWWTYWDSGCDKAWWFKNTRGCANTRWCTNARQCINITRYLSYNRDYNTGYQHNTDFRPGIPCYTRARHKMKYVTKWLLSTVVLTNCPAPSYSHIKKDNKPMQILQKNKQWAEIERQFAFTCTTHIIDSNSKSLKSHQQTKWSTKFRTNCIRLSKRGQLNNSTILWTEIKRHSPQDNKFKKKIKTN